MPICECRMAKRDSSLVGVWDVIAGYLITSTWYVCHVTPRGRYSNSKVFGSNVRARFWWIVKTNERGKFFYAYFQRNILQYRVPILFKLDNILCDSFIFYCSNFKDVEIRTFIVSYAFFFFCSRTLLDTAYNVAGIWTFVVRAQSVVSQNALYFFFSSSVRGVCGFICNTNSGDRSGFLQNSGMPFTRKVSRFLAYSEYLVYRICSKKKKRDQLR